MFFIMQCWDIFRGRYRKIRGTLSCSTLTAGSLPKNLVMESGRHIFLRVGKWPTLISEGWKVADNIFRFLESCRHVDKRLTVKTLA